MAAENRSLQGSTSTFFTMTANSDSWAPAMGCEAVPPIFFKESLRRAAMNSSNHPSPCAGEQVHTRSYRRSVCGVKSISAIRPTGWGAQVRSTFRPKPRDGLLTAGEATRDAWVRGEEKEGGLHGRRVPGSQG